MIKTFSQAIRFLESFIPPPDKKHPGELGLSRMKYLVSLLNNPQLKYPTIHVGGTSGKGSTATIIASILATKYKVGLYTSPHLERITERITILNCGSCRKSVPTSASKSPRLSSGLKASEAPVGMPSFTSPALKINDISKKEFVDLVNEVIPKIKKIKKSQFDSPSYFEIIAAMAFVYFAQKKVDLAVIEVGMGGRVDATNVIAPLVAVLTNVGLDHTEVLGDTVEKIASDKVGIIKPGIQVVSGVKQSSVIRIIKEVCRKNNAFLSLLIPPPARSPSGWTFRMNPSVFGRRSRATWQVSYGCFSYRIKNLTSQESVFDYLGEKTYRNLRLSLLGGHQVENACLAIRAVEVINSFFQGGRTSNEVRPLKGKIRERYIRGALKAVFIPGRLEVIRKLPLVILDGAHNQDKAKALAEAIKKIFPGRKVILVLAIKKGKDATGMISRLVSVSDKIILTKFRLITDLGDTFSYTPEDLYKIVKKIDNKIRVKIVNDPFQAVQEAMQSGIHRKRSESLTDLILVTGSLYLVGEVRRNFQFSIHNFQ